MTTAPDGFDFHAGDLPMLVSFPHNGTAIPEPMRSQFTSHGIRSVDTDWYVRALYNFVAHLPVSTITAHWSRYAIDLNRPATQEALYPGQTETTLCPIKTFDGDDLYLKKLPDEIEIEKRIALYWQPYHQCIAAELERLKEKYGYAILWDAHSIRGNVSALFTGTLPHLNIGTNGQSSAAAEFGEKLLDYCQQHTAYSSVLNGRFKGGFITRHYGQPATHTHAIQLEINQQSYLHDEHQVPPEMDDKKQTQLSATLSGLLSRALEIGAQLYFEKGAHKE